MSKTVCIWKTMSKVCSSYLSLPGLLFGSLNCRMRALSLESLSVSTLAISPPLVVGTNAWKLPSPQPLTSGRQGYWQIRQEFFRHSDIIERPPVSSYVSNLALRSVSDTNPTWMGVKQCSHTIYAPISLHFSSTLFSVMLPTLHKHFLMQFFPR